MNTKIISYQYCVSYHLIREENVLVAAELAKPCKSHVEHYSIPACSIFKEHTEVEQAFPCRRWLATESVQSLSHLQSDQRMRLVSICMVIDKEIPGLFMAVLSNEPILAHV